MLPKALVSLVVAVSLAGETVQRSSECRFDRTRESGPERSAQIRDEIDARLRRLQAVRVRTGGSQAEATPRNFIDEEIFAGLRKMRVTNAPLSTDEEFLRRVSLDLTGALPTPDVIRAFLADRESTKRDAAIDRLLTTPQFIDKWTMWMGDLLGNTPTLANAAINRNSEGRNAFHAYIREAVRTDKPLSTVAVELVTGKGNNYDAASGAANFPIGASTAMGPIQDTYDTMLANTAKTFLGLSHYDCLLCHDGRGRLAQVSLWGARQTRLQAQQMAAFFSRMNFSSGFPRGAYVVEDSPDGGYELNTDSGNRPARAPIGAIRTVMPAYRESGAEQPVSAGNWRAAFGAALVRDPMFARNLANRIWKQMFGLALVDPPDSLDPARLDPKSPPAAPWQLQATHPELLEKLAAQLTRQDFKLRPFLKLLAQSSTYQLSSRYESEWLAEYVPLFARHFPRRLDAEEVADAVTQSLGTPVTYGVLASLQGAKSAMQLPDTLEPANDPGVRAFLNAFLRGDRDTQERSQAGSIQQQLMLMNDPFVTDRVKSYRSPKLAALASMKDADAIEETYLTFLSRFPNDTEKSVAADHLSKTPRREDAIEDLAWMCINRAEFLFSY